MPIRVSRALRSAQRELTEINVRTSDGMLVLSSGVAVI